MRKEKAKKMKKIILLGNPNCGKTTLFNTLTKSHAVTGNRLGVTVEAKSGIYKTKNNSYTIIDLPGIFSLSPFSDEEKVVSDFLKKNDYDCIICVIDSLNPERSFALLESVLKLGKSVTVAFNFCDLLEKEKTETDIKTAEYIFGVPCVKISASKNIGIETLIETAVNSKPRSSAKPLPTPEKAVEKIFKKPQSFSLLKFHKPDKILLNKKFAYIFLLIATAIVFYLTFSGITATASEYLGYLITDVFCEKMRIFLNRISNSMLSSLICDGIIKGCGAVLGFLPQIAVLSVLLAVFEDSGYLARTAYILDRFFGKFGLQGKCFFCIMTGFGCSVPAVMSARILENKRDKIKTLLLIPFIPCSAKLPLFIMMSSLLFDSSPVFVPFLYILGCAVGLFVIGLISKFEKKGNDTFILELPPYRLPSPKSIKYTVITRLKDFLFKAGTVLVIGNILIWFLTNFNTSLSFAPNSDGSILHLIGKAILPVFKPIGLNDWKQTVSLFSGLIARESIVSSLKILYNDNIMIASAFSRASALAFCTFSLLFSPCISALTAIGKELKNFKFFILGIISQSICAYAVSFIIYNIGRLIF